jgi:hypothetical protein
MPSEDFESTDDLLTLPLEEQWHHAVAVRAYRLWQREGKPEGVRPDGTTWADHLWLLAEKRLRENAFD